MVEEIVEVELNKHVFKNTLIGLEKIPGEMCIICGQTPEEIQLGVECLHCKVTKGKVRCANGLWERDDTGGQITKSWITGSPVGGNEETFYNRMKDSIWLKAKCSNCLCFEDMRTPGESWPEEGEESND